MTPVERVEQELARYEHALMKFSARETKAGAVELVIALKEPREGVHIYYAPIHARDLQHSQFTWNFRRYLFDCLHDYVVEMFTHTPSSRD